MKEARHVAYSTNMAAALSGATVSQLRHWRHDRTGPLLEPEIARSPAAYSFRDLVALRTFVRMRETASLQKIREAIGNLRTLGEAQHLGSYELVSGPGGQVQLVTAAEAMDLGKRKGQRLLLVAMGDVIEPFPVRAGVVVPHLLQPRENLAVDPETQGGTPVIAGTRVPYDAVAGLMRDGIAAERIADYYPAVSAQGARDALDFALYVDSYAPAPRAA